MVLWHVIQLTLGDCDYSDADLARQPLPGLGDYLANYGNFGHGRSNAFQAQFERRYSHGLLLNFAYTYADQKTTALDWGNSSLGGLAWNPFTPNLDYTQDSWIPKNRVVAYGVWDLPVGRGRAYGSGFSRWADALIGGWQTSFNMFAKTGTAFTPFWICDNCGPSSIREYRRWFGGCCRRLQWSVVPACGHRQRES